jgi:hypothetical protein
MILGREERWGSYLSRDRGAKRGHSLKVNIHGNDEN